MTTETYELPSFWACPLINADYSGMEQIDIDDLNQWIKANTQPGCSMYCIGADVDNISIAVFAGTLNDVCDFTFEVSPC